MLLAGLGALAFAAIHLFGVRLTFLDVIPRSRWLSLASGIAVAYVFVHILPELAAEQQHLDATDLPIIRGLERHVYLVAVIGLALFYGLERKVKSARATPNVSGEIGPESDNLFWLHIGSFALYNTLIGYLLLHREAPGAQSLVLYLIAIGLHFFVNDYGLRRHHKGIYHAYGRWVLAGAVIAGWLVGLVLEFSDAFIAVLFSFLAGGVILNVLKEELPEERQSHFGSFALGVAGYSAVLLVS